MSKKYPLGRFITNDLYLAAYLLCSGETLCELLHNGRRRISFVFAGENVQQLCDEYRSGIVRLNVRSFRDSLKTVRAAMRCPEALVGDGKEPEKRSHTNARNHTRLQTCPT